MPFIEALEGGSRERSASGGGEQYTDRPFSIEMYEGGDEPEKSPTPTPKTAMAQALFGKLKGLGAGATPTPTPTPAPAPEGLQEEAEASPDK